VTALVIAALGALVLALVIVGAWLDERDHDDEQSRLALRRELSRHVHPSTYTDDDDRAEP
jgi:hypothetical protein